MTAELDMLPAFWMRRSRRARKAFRDMMEHKHLASPPSGERQSTAENVDTTPPAGERKPRLLAQILLDRAFTQSIVTGQPVKPWRWADTWPIARISVPRLNASSIVLAGSSGQALAFGPGHLDQTPKPGERGTAVFAAHRDTHFRFLGDLNIGDEIKVTREDGITFTYEMTGSEIVRWDKTRIDAGAKGYNLVLATCWPLDGNLSGPMRYVVHARLKPVTLFGGDGTSRHFDNEKMNKS